MMNPDRLEMHRDLTFINGGYHVQICLSFSILEIILTFKNIRFDMEVPLAVFEVMYKKLDIRHHSNSILLSNDSKKIPTKRLKNTIEDLFERPLKCSTWSKTRMIRICPHSQIKP